MFKIECPKCNEWVHLPFDIDIQETICPRCSGSIPIKDVYVSAGPYLISREVLLKNAYKYKKLLLEAEKEVEDLQRRASDSKGAKVSVQSVDIFISHLKEMIAGCRDSLRHQMEEDASLEFKINDRFFQGGIINVSVSGVCISAGNIASSINIGDEIEIRLADKNIPLFSVHGKIAWLGKGNLMGIKFSEMDQKTKELIKDYISKRSPLLKNK